MRIANLERFQRELRRRGDMLRGELGKDVGMAAGAGAERSGGGTEHGGTTDGGTDELAEVEAALERIEGGTYGRCEDCGTEMSVARLEARPHARRCEVCEG